MNLTLVRHLWGVERPFTFATHFERWQKVGYTAIECGSSFMLENPEFLQDIKREGFRWIPQIFSVAPDATVSGHLASLREQIQNALFGAPLFYNAHSGLDSWTLAQAIDFYGQTIELEKELGVTIAHETHRARYFFNPWSTRDVLNQFPTLKLTCDFSHWVCVTERLLPDCGEIIAQAAEHCHHLHARVGHSEGPQVADPRAPEAKWLLETHEDWWEIIWHAQAKRGMIDCTLTPEFGPAPYQPVLPYTEMPLANLADICDWIAVREKARFMQRSCSGNGD
jgi:sugar phosphate isomerase/epimerase